MTFRRHKAQAGYTLAELAIAIIVIGIFVAGAMSAYHLYRIEQKNEKTEFKRLRIDFALNDFKKRHGRYPCPARYDIGRDNPNYGYEGDCTDTSVAPGVCSDGICVERSVREVQIGDGSYVRPRVRRGAVPFRMLNLMEKDSYDEYGGRFSYAVTELLTDWQTFDAENGGIDVVDGQDPSEESMVDPAGSALYFVFSHGSDHVGAYNEAGALILPCSGMMFDNQNCNTSSADSEAIYRYTKASDAPVELGGSSSEGGGGEDEGEEAPPAGINLNKHYDDYSVYKGAGVAPLWKISDESGHELDAHDIGTADQNISIANGGMAEKLNIGGDLAVTDDYLTTKICNLYGGDCFEASDIGGPVGMACPEGQVAYGIGNRKLKCRIPAFRCPNGKYLSGFVRGVPQCSSVAAPVYCEAATKSVCGVSKPLPKSLANTVIDLTGGASRVQTYRCANQNDTGVWRSVSNSGVCDCTASSNTVTNGPASCGVGYEGNTTTTTTRVCPSGQTTTTTSRDACVCVSSTETETLDCPDNQTGSITQSRAITCNGNNANVGPWTETSNTCTCITRDPQTRQRNCPENQAGSITQTRTWDTAGCRWGAWTETSRDCSCVVKTERETQDCAGPLTGTREMTRTSQCPSGNWGAWTEISNNCTCGTRRVNGPERGCPAGQIGKITKSRLVDCHDTPQGPWEEESTCAAPPVCHWTTGSQTGMGNVGPMAGSECACGGNGTCKVATNMPGSFLLYDCSCK